MRTGKLMKFPRAAGDIQAYLYRDAALFRASLYVTPRGYGGAEPVATLSDPERRRAVGPGASLGRDRHYPRPA